MTTEVKIICIGGLTPDQWGEYEYAAEWCARRGLTGKIGDPLPNFLSCPVHDEINADPEAFAERVKAIAYEFAQRAHEKGKR